MDKRTYLVFIIIAIIMPSLACAGVASAKPEKGIRISAGVEKQTGYTKYQIGGHVSWSGSSENLPFPISELDFPLDSYLFFIDLNADLGAEKQFFADLSLHKNITDNSGTFEDSDWGAYWLDYNYNPTRYPYSWARQDTLDVYSASAAKTDTLIANLNAGYRIINKKPIDLAVGLGYRYQRFTCNAYNTSQWSPSYYNEYKSYLSEDPYEYNTSGKTIDYLIDYNIFYVKLSVGADIDKLSLQAGVAYSPLVFVNDTDKHLLRNLESYGSLTGTAWLCDVSARYRIYKAWSASIGYEFMNTSASGESKTLDSGAYSHTIDEKTWSAQSTLSLSLGYSF